MSSLQYCQECHREHPLETTTGIPVAYCERRIIEHFNNKPLQAVFTLTRPPRTLIPSHAPSTITQQSPPAQHSNPMPVMRMPVTLNIGQQSPLLKQQAILRDISNQTSSHNINRIAQNQKIVINKKQQRSKQMQLTANKADWLTQKSMLSTIKEDNGQSQRSYSLVTVTDSPRISSKTTSLDFRHPQPTPRRTIYHQEHRYAGEGEGECIRRAQRKPKRLYVLSGLQRREQSWHDAVTYEQRCCCL